MPIRRPIAALGLAAAGLSAVAMAQGPAPVRAQLAAQPAGGAALPSGAAQLALVRSAIEAVNQGNATANYTVLYLLASERFRQANTLEAVSNAFAGFRSRKASLSAALVLNPQLRQPASLENGMLHLVGWVPSAPEQILFDLRFVPEQGRWKMAAVNLSLSAPQASAKPASGQGAKGQKAAAAKPKP